MFRLARELGMTVGRLHHELDTYGGGVEELVEWMGYSKLEPFGFEVENFRSGVIAATVANVAPRGRGARALKPADFDPSGAKSSQLTPKQERELEQRRQRKKGR